MCIADAKFSDSKEGLKILYIIGGLGSGGKERQLFYLLKNIDKNVNVKLIVLSDNIFYKDIYRLPISLVVIERQTKYKLKTFRFLYREIKEFKPNLIHSWDNAASILLSPYIIFSSVKFITSIRYAGVLKTTILNKLIKYFSHRISDKIVSNSRKGLEVENLLTNKKSEVIYNGLDTIAFDSEFNGNNKSLNNLHVYETKVVMVGRFDSAKDYITLIRASKILSQSYSNVCFILVGDGPNRLNSEIEAGFYLNNGIYFLGSRVDVAAILSEMNIGVLLNNTNGHAEGISNAIMEYMAAGLPVIATDAGGTPELVENNVSGFLVPPFNENIVAQKIMWLIENHEESKKMGLNGRKIIENKFSINKMVASYIKLYNNLC